MSNNVESFTYKEIPESLRLASYEDALLKMMFVNKEYNEESAKELFEGLSLDESGTPYLLLLAQFGRQHNWQYFPQLVRARVSGIQSWYHVKNAGLKPGLMEIMSTLNEQGIDVMFLKGMTMQAYYDPGKVRLMHDADFVVRTKDVDRAKAIVKENYDAFDAPYDHHISVKGKTQSLNSFELHYRFINHSKCDEDFVWKRATLTEWNGIPVYIPSPEDELILACDNDSRDWGYDNYKHMALKCIYDIATLSTSYNLDWNYIVKTAHIFKVEYALHLIMSVVAYYIPNIVPADFFERLNISKEKIEKNNRYFLKCEELRRNRLPYKEKNKFVYYVIMGIRTYPYMYKMDKIKRIPIADGGFFFWVIRKVKRTKYCNDHGI